MAGQTIEYDLESVDESGVKSFREMTNRKIKPNSGRDALFNQAFFDEAMKLVA